MRRSTLRVAIVDDDASVRKALKRLLCANGYDVEAYASGPEFLDSLEACGPDCVLLDMHMRPLDGLEVHAELIRRGRPSPVIFISANNNYAMRKRALKQGAVAYLQKPLTEQSLFAVLATIRPTER